VGPTGVHPLLPLGGRAPRLQLPGRRRGDGGPRAPDTRRAPRRDSPGDRDLREEYGDWPLTAAPLATTTYSGGRGRESVVHRKGGARFAIGRGRGGQTLLTYDDLRDIGGLLRRGGWAIRELPDVRHIEVNPDRLSGRPTIRDRRLAADKVAELAKSGISGLLVLRRDYGLDRPEIEDAVRWYDVVATYERAA
jgi:uncharacterized protein (DUF433 family)